MCEGLVKVTGEENTFQECSDTQSVLKSFSQCGALGPLPLSSPQSRAKLEYLGSLRPRFKSQLAIEACQIIFGSVTNLF